MRGAAVVLLALLVLSDPSGATVYAPMDDATLAAASAAIVTGTVTATGARKRDGRIVTRTTVAVDHVYKGDVGMTVTVTTPGGEVGDERAVVFGMPSFAAGDAVLLYLQQAHGEVRTTALALGAFRLETAADGTVVATQAVPFRQTKALDDVAAGVQALGDPGSAVADAEDAGGPTTARFTFLGNPPSRWFQADQGLAVQLAVANSDAFLGPAQSLAVIDTCLASWTNVPTASIVVHRGGSTTPARSVAGGTCDGSSRIQFNDPFSEIPQLVQCTGVLAVGGFCTSGFGTLNGQQFMRISESDLTLNDGLGSCFQSEGFEEVVTHETGHALGMGHSSENPNEPNPTLRDATMYFLLHDDGRGAGLRADDIAGISALYPVQTDPNDDDGDGVSNAKDQCPSTPSGAAVDTNGCACGESGHVACDDGLSCTTDICDARTGRCAAVPIDCTGGDPCVTGTCDETTGCSTIAVTGDAAVLCVWQRPFPPVACAGEIVAKPILQHARRAEKLATRSFTRSKPKLLPLADRQLGKTRAAIDHAAMRRHRPQSATCTTALDGFVDDAHTRIMQAE